MTSMQPLLTWRRLRILVALWVLLASLYTITYSGMVESGDTRRLLDAVGSLVDYGDQYLDLTAWQFPPNEFSLSAGYPLQGANIEPMQVVAAAPLYWLAKHVPNVGLVHTTYLFNVLVGATVGSVLFLYALTLGYDERTAALATVVFGIGTAIVPYTKSFFREPLLTLCLLLAALLIEWLRRSSYRSIPLMIGALLALLALTLTKASGLLALPALLVIALPSVRGINRRLLIVLGLAGLLLAGLFIALGVLDVIPGLSARYDVLRRLADASGQYLPVALHSYLLSIGGSVWGTSPVVLLALPGVAILLRQGQFRYPLAVTLLVLAFAFGYALLNGGHWFGGLSWPPRFLIPVLALLFVGALPALDWLAHHPRSLWIVPASLLLLYSLWVQISGVSLSWSEYPQHLPPESGGFLEWGGGHNQVQYLRWVIIPQLWSFRPLDNAWAEVDAPLIPLLLGGLALVYGVWVMREIKSPNGVGTHGRAPLPPHLTPQQHAAERSTQIKALFRGRSFSRTALKRNDVSGVMGHMAVPLFVLLYLFITWAGLRVLYERDDRYQAQDESLHAMLSIISAETTPDDAILLSTPRYEAFFLNYHKSFGGGRVITLPLQPGEQTSPEQEPLVRSDFPDALLTNETIPLIHTSALTHERLWLLVEFGPDLGWSTRPVERFMSAHYYPIEYWQTAPQVRLIEYSTVSAPDMFAFHAPERLTDLVYGDVIRLVGFDLPIGTEYTSGSALPVSLYWQTDAPLDPNYTIGLFLRDANGNPAAQSDWQPAGYFAPTSGWQVGVPLWDHRALRLPSELPSGEYQLWVKVYDNPAGRSPVDLTVTGAETLDATIGVLPVGITVRNR